MIRERVGGREEEKKEGGREWIGRMSERVKRKGVLGWLYYE